MSWLLELCSLSAVLIIVAAGLLVDVGPQLHWFECLSGAFFKAEALTPKHSFHVIHSCS